MSEIADLFASLGLRVNASEWDRGQAAIGKAKSALDDLDRAATKLAASEKVARAKERDGARATRAIRSLEREEAASSRRSAVAAAAASAAALRTVSLDTAKAAKVKERGESEVAAKRKEFVQRTMAQAQVATALIGGLGAYFGQRIIRSGIQFNATMEDSKNEVAGMLSLAHKSNLSDELKTADGLVERLRERAQTLPGTTMEYIQMLSMITQPLTDAKLGLKDLEDMTVSSVVAAKGLHVPWEVAARDIDQAIRGQFHSVDPFSGKVLGSIGYKGEEGRSRFNSLTQEKRATEFRRALAQPQFAQLGEAAGQSFTGILSTLEDAWQHFQGLIAKPLFDALKLQIKDLNTWLDKNKEAVEATAKSIGEGLVTAFNSLVTVIQFLLEHGDAAIALLTAIGAMMTAMAVKSIIALGPLGLIIAAIAAVAYGIIMLVKHWDAVKDAVKSAAVAVKDAFAAALDAIAHLPIIAQLLAIISAADRLLGKGRTTEQQANVNSAMDRAGITRQESAAERTDIGNRVVGAGIPYSSGAFTRGASMNSVTVGKVDVSVNAPNADPAAVAAAVGKHFDDKMGNMLRETHDVVAP